MSALGVKETLSQRIIQQHLRCFERARDLGQRRFLGFAYRHTANAKKSAFFGRFGDMLADLFQPSLISCGITGRLSIDYCCGLPQRLDTFVLYLAELAVLELFLWLVTRCAPLGRSEIANDCFDECVCFWIVFSFR